MSPSLSSLISRRIDSRFRLTAEIAVESFGAVYRAIDIYTRNRVAVKVEAAEGDGYQLLEHEAEIYKALRKLDGVPRVHWFGVDEGHRALVLDELGPSLEDLLDRCDRQLTWWTVARLAEQMISRLEGMHLRGVVHRDVKPDNFLTGKGNNARCLYIIDFGLSKHYLDAVTGQHLPFTSGHSLTGTARYASINCHQGMECSRRDDLESLAYVLIYLCLGSLPWQELSGYIPIECAAILSMKRRVSSRSLCRSLPKAFARFLDYARGLKHSEQPDYAWARALFRGCFEGCKAPQVYMFEDIPYDWETRAGPFGVKELRTTSLVRTANATHCRCGGAQTFLPK